MHPLGHSSKERPPEAGTRSLMIPQQGPVGPPMCIGLTLTRGCFFRLLSPVACPGSPLGRGFLLHIAGFWVPPTMIMGNLALWKTLGAGEICLSDHSTNTFLGPPDHKPGI